MPTSHKADLKRLEKKVSSISNALAQLNSAEDFRRLIREWRRPGWTTPAELIFVAAIVDSMGTQVETLTNLKQNLIKGSKAVTAG